MFLQRFNPTTGKMEWLVESEDYDMRNEIIRSAYTDMLHDDERNKMYKEAIKEEIAKLKTDGKNVHALDIGTGTGLLAMLSVEHGADEATACEAFLPMARTAQQIVDKNGFGQKINVVKKHSRDVTVGKDGDMMSKANLLVSELWDTELIGEGALPTLRDASARLLEPGFVSVPAAATICVQVFSSEMLWDMHQLNTQLLTKKYGLHVPDSLRSCRGTASGFDLHVDEILNEEITLVTGAIQVLRFEFCKISLPSTCPNRVIVPDSVSSSEETTKVRQFTVSSQASQTATAHGVVMWWCLDMDSGGKITLSTAPTWLHPHGRNAQWRDHWMQAVYFLKKPLCLKKDDTLKVFCCHDDYSIWFNVQKAKQCNEITNDNKFEVERPLCTCGAHVVWSRHRFSMINDESWLEAFHGILKKFVSEGGSTKRCLCLSDCSLLPILAATLGFEKAITLEQSSPFIKLLRKMAEINNVDQQVKVLTKSVEDLSMDMIMNEKVDLILGEPFFNTSLLPWHHLYFWYATSHVMKMCGTNVKVMPAGGTLRAVAVEFQDLWKFHAPVGNLEGFDVGPFDELITSTNKANQSEDSNQSSSNCIVLEPHHIWEYPNTPLTRVFDLLKFDFTCPVPDENMSIEGEVPVIREGICHAVVLWMDFHLTDDVVLSTGLTQTSKSAKDLRWVRHTKQGVYFMRNQVKISQKTLDDEPKLAFNTVFTPNSGDIQFDFRVQDQNKQDINKQ